MKPIEQGRYCIKLVEQGKEIERKRVLKLIGEIFKDYKKHLNKKERDTLMILEEELKQKIKGEEKK